MTAAPPDRVPADAGDGPPHARWYPHVWNMTPEDVEDALAYARHPLADDHGLARLPMGHVDVLAAVLARGDLGRRTRHAAASKLAKGPLALNWVDRTPFRELALPWAALVGQAQWMTGVRFAACLRPMAMFADPQVAAWMAQRVGFITDLAERMKKLDGPSGCDFAASWRLHLVHSKAKATFKRLAKELGHAPDAAGVAEAMSPADVLTTRLAAALGHDQSEEEVAAERARQESVVAWALHYDHSVVLREDGMPWTLESRTAGGRHRLFPVRTGDWVMAIVTQIARSRKPATAAVRDAWTAAWNARVLAEHAEKQAAGTTRGAAKTVALTTPTRAGARVGTRVAGGSTGTVKDVPDRAAGRNFYGNMCLCD